MSAIQFCSAWRKNDPDLERDAKAFWSQGPRKLPLDVDPEQRAQELCALAYREGRVVGVSTATLAMVPSFRCRMAIYRCAVSLGLRRMPLSWRITEFSQEVLERWSLLNPKEGVMGLMATIESRELVMRYPQVFAPANMVFAGFDARGFPIRVAWFKHAAIPTDWPPKRSQILESPPRVKARWGGQITVESSFK